ncbi:hypothetical protein Ae201684P_014050 [Aphanomyces euteiches]|nr:hypothetical protein Ae201684P_014050 [Aphanomyces euteiches]KAH9137340.1 hypothetical protein AeRB84_017890 [Aphanomyces euteiches]
MTSKATPPKPRNAKFISFLERMGYEPQGRYAKAGKLRQIDVDALMQGPSCEAAWQWIQDNVHTSSEIEILRRNLTVSRQDHETSSEMITFKQTRRAALLEKKAQLQQALARMKQQNDDVIAEISSLEQDMKTLCDPPEDKLLANTYALQLHYRHEERYAHIREMEKLFSPPPPTTSTTSAAINGALNTIQDTFQSHRVRMLDSEAELFASGDPLPRAVQVRQQCGKLVLQSLERHLTSMPPRETMELLPFRDSRPVNIAHQIEDHIEALEDTLEARRDECDRIYSQVGRHEDNGFRRLDNRASALAKLQIVRNFCNEQTAVLSALHAAKETVATNMDEMLTFDAKVQDVQAYLASAFQRNRALVIDILDQQNKLLLFVQTHIVDAFKGLRQEYQEALDESIQSELQQVLPRQLFKNEVESAKGDEGQIERLIATIQTNIAKLDEAKAAYEAFQDASPCFAMVAWNELMDQLHRMEHDMEINVAPDVARLHDEIVELLDERLPQLDGAVHNWYQQPAKFCMDGTTE